MVISGRCLHFMGLLPKIKDVMASCVSQKSASNITTNFSLMFDFLSVLLSLNTDQCFQYVIESASAGKPC